MLKHNNNNNNNKYQNYIDHLNVKYDSHTYNIQHIRVLKNNFYENTFVLKTKFRLNKKILTNIFNKLDPTFDILEITETWLGEKMLNEENMNDGIIEWFIKLKEKISFNKLDYIGGSVKSEQLGEIAFRHPNKEKSFNIPTGNNFGFFDNEYPTLVNFIDPLKRSLKKQLPSFSIRYDHINNKYKIPIYFVINSKLFDKAWYASDNSDVHIDEIYIYVKYYIKHFLSSQNSEHYIKNIMLTDDGWYVNISL